METQSTEEEKLVPSPIETPVPAPQNPPPIEIPVQNTDSSPSIKECTSPIHQRAGAIEFHDLSLNVDKPKTEPQLETLILVPTAGIPQENPPPIEIPVQNTEPSLSIKENTSPIHQRAATIDFHDLSLNVDKPKTEPEVETPIPVPVPVPVPVAEPVTEPKMTRSQSVPSNSMDLNLASPRPSLDGLSEEKEVNRFSDVSNEMLAMPVRLRVRDFKPEVPAGEPGPRVKVDRGRPGSDRGFVERESRLESVKSVVSKFGGSVSWKAPRINSPHKTQTTQQSGSTRLATLELEKIRRESAQYKMKSETMEASKAEIMKELDHKNSLIEKLRLDLDQAETEESRAKQELHRLNKNLEMLQLFSQETEQDSKVDLVKSRRDEAINELKSVNEEIKSLHEQCDILVKEKETLVSKAEAAVFNSKKIEKTIQDLSEELDEVKKSLERASTAKTEAEEHKIGAGLAKDQDCITWKKEIREAQEELEKLQMQILLAKDLEVKLESSRGLLAKLNAELAGFMEIREKEEEVKTVEIVESKRKEVEEVKEKTEKIKEEINALQIEGSSVKTELERAKMELDSMKQREGMSSIAGSSVETEIEKTKEQKNISIVKEKEMRDKIIELPKLMKEAALETEKSKSIAETAQEEVKKAKAESETVNNSLKTLEIKIHAAIKEIEAYKLSEKIALSAIKALNESEDDNNVTEKIIISFDEYFSLSQRAHEAEELTQTHIQSAIKQVESAKDSESNNLTKLNEMYKELEEKRKALLDAEEKAIKAEEGKSAMEQELRQWRTESEQSRKSDAAIKDVIKSKESNNTEEMVNNNNNNNNKSSSSGNSFERFSLSKSFSTEEGDLLVHPMVDPVYTSSLDGTEGKEKKKKKNFFPRVIMFMAKKKAQKQASRSS